MTRGGVLPESGLVAVVKRDCPTCALVAPVLRALSDAGAPLAVYSQDDPDFPDGLAGVRDDTELEASWRLGVTIVPTLVRLDAGAETGRAIGWNREEWRNLTGDRKLGAGLPGNRPGCGSLTEEPDAVYRLRARYGNTGLAAREVVLAPDADAVEACYERGWTDGMPVVPPSEESVGAMLAAAGLRGEEVIGEIPDRHARITADKVAVNAVLAGCRPEYMPVVVAAVKGICHPDYCYHGAATSTGGSAVAMIVNGPVGPRLGINARDNVLGQGFRANATIGRAVRLVMMNAINTRPGKLDRSTMGNPGKYSLCFAENEADSPWEPLHVERGFRPEESAVTVFASEAAIQVYNQLSNTTEQLLLTFADAMSNLGSMNIVGQAQLIVVFAGEHCETLRAGGWSKRRIKEYLYEHARRTVAEVKRAGRLAGPVQPEDERTWRHPTKSPEDIVVVAAGGRAGAFSSILMGWGSAAHTRSITTPVVLP